MSNPTVQQVRTLVPATNLSPASDIAIEQAVLLAKQGDAERGCCMSATMVSAHRSRPSKKRIVGRAAPVLVLRNCLSQQVGEIVARHAARRWSAS